MFPPYTPFRLLDLSPGHRAVVATRPIAAGELLLDLSPDRYVSSEIATSLLGRLDASDHVLLALFLLSPDRPRRWDPYLRSLPARLPEHPFWWSPGDLSLLQGTSLLPVIEARRSAIVEERRRLLPRLPWLRDVDEERYQLARVLVSSRAFARGDGAALMPFADLLNHSATPETAWRFDAENGHFLLHATTAIPEGAEVHDSYGKKGNARLLLQYGFTLPGNSDAEVHLDVGPHGTFCLPARWGSPDAIRLFSRLRLDFADSEELARVEDVDPVAFPLSVRNETAVLEHVLFACRAALARLPTVRISRASSFAYRQAVDVRQGERVALTWYLGLCRLGLRLLRSPPRARLRILGTEAAMPYREYLEG